MHVSFGPRATAFSGLFAGKCYSDRLVVDAVDSLVGPALLGRRE